MRDQRTPAFDITLGLGLKRPKRKSDVILITREALRVVSRPQLVQTVRLDAHHEQVERVREVRDEHLEEPMRLEVSIPGRLVDLCDKSVQRLVKQRHRSVPTLFDDSRQRILFRGVVRESRYRPIDFPFVSLRTNTWRVISGKKKSCSSDRSHRRLPRSMCSRHPAESSRRNARRRARACATSAAFVALERPLPHALGVTRLGRGYETSGVDEKSLHYHVALRPPILAFRHH